VISAKCIQSWRATAARPAANTKAPCPAVVVFLRPSAMRMQGTVGDAGSAGRSLIGSTTLIAISRRYWKDGRQSVELSCPIDLFCRTRQRSLSPDHAVPSSDLPWSDYGRALLMYEL
jgi:hypothetical protein